MFNTQQIEMAQKTMVALNGDCFIYLPFVVARMTAIRNEHPQTDLLTSDEKKLIEDAIDYFMSAYFKVNFDGVQPFSQNRIDLICEKFSIMQEGVSSNYDINDLEFAKSCSMTYFDNEHINSIFENDFFFTLAVAIESYKKTIKMLNEYCDSSGLLGFSYLTIKDESWLSLFLTPRGALLRETKIAEIGNMKLDEEFLREEFLLKEDLFIVKPKESFFEHNSDLVLTMSDYYMRTRQTVYNRQTGAAYVDERTGSGYFWRHIRQNPKDCGVLIFPIFKHDFYYNLYTMGMCRFKLGIVEGPLT